MSREHATSNDNCQNGQTRSIIVYIFLLVALFGTSFLPTQRMWGLSVWAYFPLWARFLLLAAGGAALPAGLWISRRVDSRPLPLKPWVHYATLCSIVLIGAVSFWLLRNTTHFLGNGYSHLANLSGAHPIIKWHEPGESLLHLWLAQAFGENSTAHVLLSYQLFSVFAGILFLTIVVWTSMRLFDDLPRRLLFSLGLATSGHMLLFFGYVENRSLFVLGVGAFTLAGILIAQKKLPVWLAPAILGLTLFMHIFGVILIPATMYMLISRTRLGSILEELSQKLRILLGLGLALALLSALAIGFQKSLFFRIALLTITESRFTIEGYTLFSAAHLADYANLLFILVLAFHCWRLLFLPPA